MERFQKYSMHAYMYTYFTAVAVFAPFLGFWFSENGLTNQQIGLLFSIGPVLGLFLQPLWGLLCDRYGAERSVLIICLTLSPMFAFGYQYAGSFSVFLITAVLLAVFNSPISPIADAMTVNHAAKYGQSYGSIRVLGSISFAIAVTPIGIFYGASGLDNIFLAYLIAMLSTLIFVLMLKKPKIQTRSVFKGVKQLLSQKGYLYFLLLILICTVGSQFLNIFFGVYLSHLGGNVSQKIGVLNTVSALSELPFFILSSLLLKRFGYPAILSLCALVASLRWLILSFEPDFTVLLFTQVLHGLTYALFFAAGVNYAYEMSPAEAKTTGQTLFSIVYINMANIIASNLGGWVTDQYGFSVSFKFAAISTLVGAFGFMVLWFKSRKMVFQSPQ